jgi:hypothetical protein
MGSLAYCVKNQGLHYIGACQTSKITAWSQCVTRSKRCQRQKSPPHFQILPPPLNPWAVDAKAGVPLNKIPNRKRKRKKSEEELQANLWTLLRVAKGIQLPADLEGTYLNYPLLCFPYPTTLFPASGYHAMNAGISSSSSRQPKRVRIRHRPINALSTTTHTSASPCFTCRELALF